MKADLERELQEKTRWTPEDTRRLVQSRPAVRLWRFAPGCTFDSGALSPLSDATALVHLSFRDAALSDGNLQALATPSRLVRLDLHGCEFTSQGFAALCHTLAKNKESKLSELWLENTAIADDDLQTVGILSPLRWLILSGTKVTDDGLDHLCHLNHLETLWLERTQVTDDGVLRLTSLPRLTAVPTRQTACSADLPQRLFRAQMALQGPAKAAAPAQQEAADTRLRAFLTAMEDWERSAYRRAQQIERTFRAQRPEAHVLSQAESQASDTFWQEINAEKSHIAEEFCTTALQARGAGRAQSYGNPPHFTAPTKPWLSIATPSRTKTVFIAESLADDVYRGRRYTLKLEHDQWRLDTVHLWSGGWKTDPV